MSIPDITEYLKIRFQQKREYHPSFRLLDIDDNLFPNGIVTFETEARDSDNRLKTVKDIIAESWKKGEKNHLMIQGEAGIGKTVMLLSIPDRCAPYSVPAIYIPLHDIGRGRSDDMIESYIKDLVLDDDEELFRQLKELLNKEWNQGPRLLLLLDGFNEIPNELRGAISNDLERWSEYPGVQIITSSRFDIHQYVYLRSSFSKIELQPLSENTVLGYLGNNDIGVPKNSSLTKLITNPLLLTLFNKTETIRRTRPTPFAKFLETKNAGTLIWNYLQSELWRFRHNSEEAKASVLAMEFIAPYVAWTMQQNLEFVVDKASFLDRIDEAYRLMNKQIENKGAFPAHIKTILLQSSERLYFDKIVDLLEERLCLFVRDDRGYRLMYQQFRDALAAMHLINSIYLHGNSRPIEWNSAMDHYVLQFVVDLISEDEAMQLWEQNRKAHPQLETATLNQLELQNRLHNSDFSRLNFSGLDLRDISLFPYRINKSWLKLPTKADDWDGTILSEKTFSNESHEGPITSIALTPNGKYIVSGSSDNTIRVWDLESGKCLKTLREHEKSVNAVAVTADSSKVISGSSDKTIRVWDLESGKCLNTLSGHERPVYSVTVSSDERIESESFDGTTRVWDLKSGNCIKIIEGLGSWNEASSMTIDDRYIIRGSWKNICILDSETGIRLKLLIGHKARVNSVAVTSNNKRIVSGSDDRTIRIWDLETGLCLKTIGGYQEIVSTIVETLDFSKAIITSPMLKKQLLQYVAFVQFPNHTDNVIEWLH
jgi:WD40 repeat protein